MDNNWSIQQSLDLYAVERWGDGFFHINDAGHLVVRPRPSETAEIDLLELMGDLRRRGLRTP
ncbi:MAG: hypothetical protein CBC48_17465, partial [bacterium TMED88]